MLAGRAYFNPRPREEGDISSGNISKTVSISIHALVKRATFKSAVAFSTADISIHALVKRATFPQRASLLLLQFQSTPS